MLRAGIDGEVPTPTVQPGELMQLRKFETTLTQTNVNLDALRKIAWNGCPVVARPLVWQLLLGLGQGYSLLLAAANTLSPE